MFRADSLYAARCYSALFRGSRSVHAAIAGEQLHRAVSYWCAWIEAQGRRR
jgi:hypothetical protein